MKANWVKRFCRGLLVTGLAGAGLGLVGCADHYAAYPAYRGGGYYASYHAPYPYYRGYGYPYRAYGPYYGYSRSHYGYPYYGGNTVVVSRNRSYGYRDQYGRSNNRRVVNRNANRVRNKARNNPSRRQIQQSSDNDDETRYYNTRQP